MSSVVKGVKNAVGGLFGTEQGTIPTTSTNTPYAPLQPYLADIFRRGQAQANSGAPITADASQALQGYLNPGFLNPSSNPAFVSSVNDALGLAKSQFAGQYGGAAGQNLGNSGYQEALARGLGAAATNAYSDQFNKNMSAQLGAISASPAFDPLERYKSILSLGVPFNQTNSQQPYFQNNTATTLGALSAGGTMAASFLPFLKASDVRVKENIERIGTHDSGIGIFKFNYIGDQEPQIGVMAQEVAQVKPDAVHNVGGLLAVDYNKI